MQQVNSSEFKNHFGEFLELVREQPVAVNKFGQPVAVLMSAVEYKYLQRLEDLYWIARAEAAEQSGGWIGHDEALRLLTDRLKRAE